MAWTTANTELRALLNDGPTDKPRFRKTCLGILNGTNPSFKTFEPRRITDLSTASGSFGVFVNGAAVTVSSDAPEFGEFVLAAAPDNTDTLEASYYVQWFNDDELNSFLTSSAEWLGLIITINIEEGLRPAAKKYAAAEAYQKLAIRWSQLESAQFKMADSDPKNSPVNEYMNMADKFRKDATASRDEFYKRQGRSLQPLFGTVVGRFRRTTPNR